MLLFSMHNMKAHEDRKMEKKCAPFPMDNEIAMIYEVCHHSGSNGTETMALLFGHSQKDYVEILIYVARLLLTQPR